jgi:hypothetical protein
MYMNIEVLGASQAKLFAFGLEHCDLRLLCVGASGKELPALKQERMDIQVLQAAGC